MLSVDLRNGAEWIQELAWDWKEAGEVKGQGKLYQFSGWSAFCTHNSPSAARWSPLDTFSPCQGLKHLQSSSVAAFHCPQPHKYFLQRQGKCQVSWPITKKLPQPCRLHIQVNNVSPSWAVLPILSTQPIKSLIRQAESLFRLPSSTIPSSLPLSSGAISKATETRWEKTHLTAGWAPSSAMGVEGWSSRKQSSSALVLPQKMV